MLQHHLLLKDWFDNHTALGGYVASSYVDWNVVQNPIYDFVKLLEEYKRIDYLKIEDFAQADATNNSMVHRGVLEDVSKIKYLTEAIMSEELIFHPQIIHEPWFNRYRVHPGSGRAIALWLCGFTQFKTIYTHFAEPGFKPPGDTIKIDSWKSLGTEILVQGNPSPLTSQSRYQVETFQAFPSTVKDMFLTSDKDNIWAPDIVTTKPWEFLVYSEGDKFLDYKKEWRMYGYDLYSDLQHSITQIGRTIFEFRGNKVIRVIRDNEVYNFVD